VCVWGGESIVIFWETGVCVIGGERKSVCGRERGGLHVCMLNPLRRCLSFPPLCTRTCFWCARTHFWLWPLFVACWHITHTTHPHTHTHTHTHTPAMDIAYRAVQQAGSTVALSSRHGFLSIPAIMDNGIYLYIVLWMNVCICVHVCLCMHVYVSCVRIYIADVNRI